MELYSSLIVDIYREHGAYHLYTCSSSSAVTVNPTAGRVDRAPQPKLDMLLGWVEEGKYSIAVAILFPMSGSLSGGDRTVDPAAIPRSLSVAMFALLPHAKKTFFCPTGRGTLHSREYQDQTANWKPRNIWVMSYFPEQADYYGCPAVP